MALASTYPAASQSSITTLLDLTHYRWAGLPVGLRLLLGWRSEIQGDHTIVFDFNIRWTWSWHGGHGRSDLLMVKELSRKTIPHTIPLLMSIDETFDVGVDTRTAVNNDYQLPFRFTGTINKLTFNLRPSQLTSMRSENR